VLGYSELISFPQQHSCYKEFQALKLNSLIFVIFFEYLRNQDNKKYIKAILRHDFIWDLARVQQAATL